ncbi:MAG: hypothetical protein ACREQN_04240, partial [Candidatus Binataceae bacterium]
DDYLRVPQTGTVTFSNSGAPGCAAGNPVAAPGFVVEPFATGFAARSFLYGDVNWNCTGAFPPAFDASGNAYVSDFYDGNIYKFPATGGVAGSATLLTATAIGPTLSQPVFDNGNLYVSRATTSSTSFNATGAILQINPSNGAVIKTVITGLTCPLALAVDPLSGDLFTDDNCFGAGSDNPALWRISNPSGANPTLSVYAMLPGTNNGQVSFASDGTIYVQGNGTVAEVSGTNSSTVTVTTLSGVIPSAGGLIAEGSQSGGGAQFLILGQNNQTTTEDLTTNPPALASIFTTTPMGGTGLVAGPDGCVYGAGFGNSVIRLTDAGGKCLFPSGSQPATLTLSPPIVSPNPAQGAAQSFTANFHYVSVPDGTPVLLSVGGANPQVLQANTAGGAAAFSYTAVHQGVDTLVASAAVGSTEVASNQAVVTWGPGTDVTFLTLNQSPTTGTTNQAVTLSVNLTDTSVNPVAPIANQQVSFTLGGASCASTTDANGNATCQATVGGSGIITLGASFAATSQYNASSDSKSFNVLAPTPIPSPTPTPTPIPTSTPTPTPTPTATPTMLPTATPTPAIGGSVTLLSSGNGHGGAGQSLSGGSFSYTNTGGGAQTLSSVTLSITQPELFSSITLAPAVSETRQPAVTVRAPEITRATTFTFALGLNIPAGGKATFSLSMTIASGKTASANDHTIVLAGMLAVPGTPGGGDGGAGLLGGMILLGIAMLPLAARTRRRVPWMAGVMLILAIGVAGCGPDNNNGPKASAPSSTQNVTAVTVKQHGSASPVSGLPLKLGKISRE